MLPRAVLEAVYAHAEVGYPEEVCGLIFAARAEPAARYPGAVARPCDNEQNALHARDPNAFPRDGRSAYSLPAEALIALDESLRGDRPVRIIYHSHVEAGACFSDEDARAAAPGGELMYPVDHLVVDVRKDGAHGHRLFHFDAGRFVEIDHVRR